MGADFLAVTGCGEPEVRQWQFLLTYCSFSFYILAIVFVIKRYCIFFSICLDSKGKTNCDDMRQTYVQTHAVLFCHNVDTTVELTKLL